MSEFSKFKLVINNKFQELVDKHNALFITSIDKDELWNAYLNAFPEGTNEIYRERTSHNCTACMRFIRDVGNVVAIENNKLISIWDVEAEYPYDVVANILSNMVKSKPIDNILINDLAFVGVDKNFEQMEGKVHTWHHLYFKLPSRFVQSGRISSDAIKGEKRTTKEVFKRALDEITKDAINTCVELIEQGSLYRGDEHLNLVKTFNTTKHVYDLVPNEEKDNYVWLVSQSLPVSITKIRSSVIGTLLIDLSEGIIDLDSAVKMFESKVAPENYKRPTTVVTKRMVEEAEKALDELGMKESLGRRYATVDDITANNIIFANRDTKKILNVFDEMKEGSTINLKSFDKIEQVSISTFINDIVPKATSIEVLFQNNQEGNLMNLIAPINSNAPSMFKWDNGFSWSYNGDLADAIKERVKKAGGSISGELRCSLSWHNFDDLDIHVIEPNGNTIYYGNRRSITGGKLDVDMNAMGHRDPNPVENITWENKSIMATGTYQVFVHNFALRETKNLGFEVEIECQGNILNFEYTRGIKNYERIRIATFEYSKTNGIKLLESIPESTRSRKIWNIDTNTFQEVSMIMYSPNHWNNKPIGNKHYFFILNKCKNDGTTRGFFNEYLNEELMKQKRVFEVLGSKMKVEPSDVQLSGIGFSSTKNTSLICRVSGTFNRTIKVNF